MEKKKIILKRFGWRVSQIRRSRKMTVADLARLTGTDQRHIVRIELGEVNILYTTILTLAEALEVSPEELLQGL